MTLFCRSRDCQRNGGSGSHRQVGHRIGVSFENLTGPRTKLTIDDSATNLEQEVSAAAGPSHLLGFVHATVDQEVGGAFGDRRADPQTGTVAFSIVDQPNALA